MSSRAEMQELVETASSAITGEDRKHADEMIERWLAERERAANEQGWDDAVRWLRYNRDAHSRDALDRDFNPYRKIRSNTEIVVSDGHQ